MTDQTPMLRRNVKFDTKLKEFDKEYRTTLINFAKYKLVMFAMAKLIEMETTEPNQIVLYIFNAFSFQNLHLFLICAIIIIDGNF